MTKAPSVEPTKVLVPDADPRIGAILSDRYRVDEKLGEGGMGVVYRGEHVRMHKPVAIKILHKDMTALDEVVKRFEREAIAAGRIAHPNVASATDFGKLEDGSFFLVLEYVAGKSLSSILSEGGAMPVERAAFIAAQIASALSAAHAAGIVHRDLKPDNVMLVEKEGTGDFVKVLDFGIAKVERSGGTALTTLGSVFGTPQYMSPEQAAGKVVDARTDLYALGLIFHEMLSGRPAFESDDVIALLTKQMTESPPPLPQSTPVAASMLVDDLVKKDPSLRIQTADEVIARMERLAKIGGAVASARTGLALPSTKRPKPLLRIFGFAFPIWHVAALTLVLGAVVAYFLLTASSGDEGVVAEPEPPPPPDVAKRLALAEVGQADAIREIEAGKEADRLPVEWLALAKGYHKTGRVLDSLRAFERAVKADARLAVDPTMLRVARQSVASEASRDVALDLAAKVLAAPGADLLFDVWSETSERTAATVRAKELIDSESVRKNASPALRVALELREAKACAAAKGLLPTAAKLGDERSLRPLQRMSKSGGCGFLGLGDCFPCLRSGTELTEAIDAVQTRAAPRF